MNKMNVTSAQYMNSSTGAKNISIKAMIDGKEWFVPPDPDNRYYTAILEWVAEGNTIQDAE